MSPQSSDQSTPIQIEDRGRAKVQAHLREIRNLDAPGDQGANESRSETITPLTRDGEPLWVFPDANRHERRVQRAIVSEHDRIFWATITIACGDPGIVASELYKEPSYLAKQYGHLEKARNDLDSFYDYYRPMQIGDPFVVAVAPGLGKSPGYFDCSVRSR